MQGLVSQVKILHADMSKLTLESGVSQSTYYKLINTIEEDPEEIVKEKLIFLEEVKPIYMEVSRIYSLVPPEAWEMYKKFGEKDFTEQIELRKVQLALKIIWNKKYGKKS